MGGWPYDQERDGYLWEREDDERERHYYADLHPEYKGFPHPLPAGSSADPFIPGTDSVEWVERPVRDRYKTSLSDPPPDGGLSQRAGASPPAGAPARPLDWIAVVIVALGATMGFLVVLAALAGALVVGP